MSDTKSLPSLLNHVSDKELLHNIQNVLRNIITYLPPPIQQLIFFYAHPRMQPGFIMPLKTQVRAITVNDQYVFIGGHETLSIHRNERTLSLVKQINNNLETQALTYYHGWLLIRCRSRKLCHADVRSSNPDLWIVHEAPLLFIGGKDPYRFEVVGDYVYCFCERFSTLVYRLSCSESRLLVTPAYLLENVILQCYCSTIVANGSSPTLLVAGNVPADCMSDSPAEVFSACDGTVHRLKILLGDDEEMSPFWKIEGMTLVQGRLFVLCSRSMRVYDLATGKLLRERAIQDGISEFSSIASIDDEYLLLGDVSGVVHVYPISCF